MHSPERPDRRSLPHPPYTFTDHSCPLAFDAHAPVNWDPVLRIGELEPSHDWTGIERRRRWSSSR